MKKFLKKIITLVLLYLLIIQVSSIFFPFYGNQLINKKFSWIKNDTSKNEINTLYFGSSHAYRHLNPSIIDSINGKTSSFNMGGIGTFPLENLYIIEKTLSKYSNIKYALVQIQTPRVIDDKNVMAEQSIYYSNFKTLVRAINYRKLNKWFSSKNFFKSFLLRMIRYQNSVPVQSPIVLEDEILKNNGFLSLDDQQYLLNDTNLADRHIEVFKKKFVRTINKQKEKRSPSIGEEWMIDELIKIAKKNETIKFIFFFNPLHNINFKSLKKKKLPYNCQIIFMNNTEIIENIDYYYDRGHMNKKGAEIYSKKIGEFLRTNL